MSQLSKQSSKAWIDPNTNVGGVYIDPHQPRWALIRRARRDIQAGLHDDESHTDARLDVCLEAILADILPVH